ncbi:YhdP family protein [Variovorax sp. ZT4R33]|uniref:YhdP family protein n=1 Tax=Variovorax sp. ZT4R33 TaxID=3443743 RepID=UPI003F446398
MNETATHPTRLLKITAVSAKWLLGLVIAAWLLFAGSVVVLHGWIVPRIGEYRGLVEAQASRIIGVPVRIGAITAKSGTLFPTFELRDVVLHDAHQREALRLPRVVASVSPRSLWRLSFVQLYVQNPQLDVRLDAQGKLHVAGLDMSTETSGEARGADWFFSQREFVIEGGTVRWTDERRGAEPLLLTDVRFAARNGSRRHAMRLDATPPEGWGERFTLRGEFRQPLLSVRRGNWQRWDGQLYTELPHIDVRRLGRYVSLDARIRDGRGGVRAWADVRNGQVVGGAVDLSLDRIDASLDAGLEPLVLRAVTGRIAGRMSDRTLEVSTTALQFDAADGLRWPGGNLWFQHTPVQGRSPERGALRADRLDLAALNLIATRLPLGDTTHRLLAAYAPRGVVEHIDASWQGSLAAPHRYQARGSLSAFSVAAQPVAASTTGKAAVDASPHAGTPGLSGAAIRFDATQDGGKATLAIAQGVLDFPGVFEEPRIPIDRLSGQLQWKLDGDKAQLQVSELRFENADAAGEARATWRTSDPAVSHGKSRYPGVLDLQGQLERANGTRVYRYLPLDIPKHTRAYVQESVTRGSASAVEFRVRGDLHDMPFTDPRDGDFRIAAKVSDVTYAYVPPSEVAAGKSLAWPALTGVSGDLIFERAGMQVRNARGRIAGAPGIEVSKADVQIQDLSHRAPLLVVDAQARGPLGELLKAGAPLAGESAGTVAAVRATGNADYRLKLDLPLEGMDKAKVQASVVLGGNDLQLAPEAPVFGQAHGTLSFTESGFQLAGVQGRIAGGETRIEGRGRYGSSTAAEMSFRAQGSVTADGLRATPEVDWLPRLAAKAGGGTAYAATLSVRDGTPEFSVSSTLQGLSLDLPAPLAKRADETMPLQVEKKVVLREARAGAAPLLHDRISLALGSVASAHYVRDLGGAEARVLQGAIGVGLPAGEAPVAPARGVQATLHLADFDLPAWQALFGQAAGPAAESGGSGAEPSSYLPTAVAVRARALDIGGGRTLHDVVLGGSREGALWRANIDAAELSGYVEYRQSQDGRIYARLSRLKIAASEAKNVESLLDEQPGTLPALDVVIDDFELLGRHLGRAEIDAVNRGGARREWRLNKLAFTMPEASFTAQGTWAGNDAAQRRTAMNFKLDIADAGTLLARFNMKDVVRRGRGRLEGEVDWRGSPLSLDYPSLNGQVHLDVATGQFLKADPGLAKLLGVLSLQALPRRLTLDFRDIFSEGFAFDFIRGDATIANGVASTNNLQMKGVNAAVLMDGAADIAHETQNLRVVVVPEISAGTAALVATAINPLIGLSTFLAQALLSKPLAAAATQEFQIEGTWTDPKITKVPRRALPAARDALTKEITP